MTEEQTLPPALAVLLEDPARSAVLTDFDGTLAPIVPDPETARPLEAAPAVLAALARHFGVVAVISGRPAPFLARHLAGGGPDVLLYGGYGVEWITGGALQRAPEVEPWVPVVAEVRAQAQAAAPPALGIEDKGFALTLHWRRHPELGAWAEAFAAEQAARHGLALQPGRQAVELRPPVGPDKGTVVEQLAAGTRAAVFAGDDAGDLPAFDALDRLAAQGLRGVRLAVADRESPPELLARADLVLDGPERAVAVLELVAAAAAAG